MAIKSWRKLIAQQTLEPKGVTSKLRIDRLDRDDLARRISCLASNTDLVEPKRAHFKIDMLRTNRQALLIKAVIEIAT